MKKQLNALQLKRSVISNLQGETVKGGDLPTTQQSTVVFTNDCKSDSCDGDPRPGTISYSNCGQCGGW
ncbi:hypothetical protein H2O64_23620 [Kordia sp. YSTF-M3]|uniref:Natural product n=1 Tax=Kordia aestuariivivens TaxID=2759037 RepID=A0ABR7QGP2_9FLAO|nr:hypothetical protein [Kordia aestuariivivens]MBC8757678.1 hypothetical protein [Kordia aestuariivivens]